MAHQDEFEALVHRVIGCGLQVHRDLGPGLLESVYEVFLAEELNAAGISSARQVAVPIVHKGIVIDNDFKADLLVEGQLLIELKSVERIAAVHGKQVLTYLRLMNLPLGLLMNFGQATFKDGLMRIANNYFGKIT